MGMDDGPGTALCPKLSWGEGFAVARRWRAGEGEKGIAGIVGVNARLGDQISPTWWFKKSWPSTELELSRKRRRVDAEDSSVGPRSGSRWEVAVGKVAPRSKLVPENGSGTDGRASSAGSRTRPSLRRSSSTLLDMASSVDAVNGMGE